MSKKGKIKRTVKKQLRYNYLEFFAMTSTFEFIQRFRIAWRILKKAGPKNMSRRETYTYKRLVKAWEEK